MCASYFIGNTEIQSTDEERDLGVIVHKSLKVSCQCNKVVKEAYSILGVINRCFLNKTKDIFWCVLCVWAKLPEIKLDDVSVCIRVLEYSIRYSIT